jgi:hypothetical protein
MGVVFAMVRVGPTKCPWGGACARVVEYSGELGSSFPREGQVRIRYREITVQAWPSSHIILGSHSSSNVLHKP